MQDIADRAGVTKTTVSLALRGDRRISSQTRERIEALAEEMGYRPNPLVSSLMTQVQSGKGVSKGTRLALLAPPGNEHWAIHSPYGYARAVYEGIRKRAEMLGYGVDIVEPEPGQTSFTSCVRVMQHRGLRGVILPPFQPPALEFDAEFDCEGFAVVAVGHSQNISGIHRVAHSLFQIAYDSTNRIVNKGYRRVGMHLSPEMNHRTGHKSPGGFMGALSEYPNMSFSEENLLYTHGEATPLLLWVKKLKLDAILTQYPSDYDILMDAGFGIPEDLGFVLLSSSEGEDFMTGTYHDPRTLAFAAVEFITAQLNRNETGKPASPKLVMTQGVWREGETL